VRIEILGTGCKKCQDLEKNAKVAISKLNGYHQVIKVQDVTKIMEFNVISTPALVIDGVVLSSGKLLSVEEIFELMKGCIYQKLM
jgi:small redox-active disulfide protein 2